jgi:hypothetical protein
LISFIFSFHHFTAEAQRLPPKPGKNLSQTGMRIGRAWHLHVRLIEQSINVDYALHRLSLDQWVSIDLPRTPQNLFLGSQSDPD